MKSVLFFISFFVISIGISSASVTNSEAINECFKLITEYNLTMDKSMSCLRNFYHNILKYRSSKSSYRSISLTCTVQDDPQILANCLSKVSGISQPYSKKISDDLIAVNQLYIGVIQSINEIEVYTRLKDYEKDSAKQGLIYVDQVLDKYNKFRQKELEIVDYLNMAFWKTTQLNTGTVYYKAYSAMTKTFTSESSLLDAWGINIHDDVFSNSLPLRRMIDNINISDFQYEYYVYPNGLKYPSDHYFKSFCEVIIGDLQSFKRNALNNANFASEENDDHSNWVYSSCINYYNNSLLPFYKLFVETISQYGVYFPLQPSYPKKYFLISNKPILSKTTCEFMPDSLNNFSFPNKTKTISIQEINAMNHYTEYINEITWSTKYFVNSVKQYQLDVNAFLEKKRKTIPKFSISKEMKFPTAEYERAIFHSSYLDKNAAVRFNSLCSVIQKYYCELEILLLSLDKNAKDKSSAENNFKTTIEQLKRIELILDQYNSQKDLLYSGIVKYYESFSIGLTSNPWLKSSKALDSIVRTEKKIVQEARDYIWRNGIIPDSTLIQSLARSVIANEFSNMNGLTRIGSSHGHCPYTSYQEIGENAYKVMVQRVIDIKEITQNSTELEKDRMYDDFLYTYNHHVENYNKFVWLAKGGYETYDSHKGIRPIYLLNEIYEPELLNLPNPKKIKNDSIQETKIVNTNPEDIFAPMTGYAICNLVFLLDISGSMNKPEKIDLLKQSMKKLINILRQEDLISIVVFSGNATTLVESESAKSGKVLEALENLKASGTTNANLGLQFAYKAAVKGFKEGGNNRIILATDGEFQLSEKTKDLVKENQTIYFSSFIFGKKDEKFSNIIELTEMTKGNYVNIDEGNMNQKMSLEAKSILKD